MALRFLLGFIEAAIPPSLTMLVTGFYKKDEQAPRNARTLSYILVPSYLPACVLKGEKGREVIEGELTLCHPPLVVFAYFSSVINGFFAFVVGKIPDSAPLLKWQYLYIITGVTNILYSIFLFFVLPDNPMNARFLTQEQKYHATQRLAVNRTGIHNKVWKWEQVWEALLDIKIWIIFVFNIIINIPNGGLVAFGSIIINNLGFDALESSLLTMPFGVVATGGAWVFGYIAARWHNRRTLLSCFALLLPIFGTSLVYAMPRSNIPAQMVGLYFMYFYWRKFLVFSISLVLPFFFFPSLPFLLNFLQHFPSPPCHASPNFRPTLLILLTIPAGQHPTLWASPSSRPIRPARPRSRSLIAW